MVADPQEVIDNRRILITVRLAPKTVDFLDKVIKAQNAPNEGRAIDAMAEICQRVFGSEGVVYKEALRVKKIRRFVRTEPRKLHR